MCRCTTRAPSQSQLRTAVPQFLATSGRFAVHENKKTVATQMHCPDPGHERVIWFMVPSQVRSQSQFRTRNSQFLSKSSRFVVQNNRKTVWKVQELLHINVQRLWGGLVFKAHRLRLSLNFRLESIKEETGLEVTGEARNLSSTRRAVAGADARVAPPRRHRPIERRSGS